MIAISTYGSPVVVNTWPFVDATSAAWRSLLESADPKSAALNAVEQGCSKCENDQCDFTVGYGGSPDEDGDTTLDAMIMSGKDMHVGSVCNLQHVKDAISTARLVMDHSTHTTLSGLQATAFAQEMGMMLTNLSTPASSSAFYSWKEARCQPNFRCHVSPKAAESCGPYKPNGANQLYAHSANGHEGHSSVSSTWPSRQDHDTIAMVAIDAKGNIAAGASSNGASHKVPGRIGDACVAGGAAYADNDVGGCGSTGDGDLHLRFQPCYQVVESMRQGATPKQAAEDAIQRIVKHYPLYVGALFAVNKDGNHAGACHGWTFQYAFQDNTLTAPQVVTVQPVKRQDCTSQHDRQCTKLKVKPTV
ncbi:hypothetical protein WJX77_010669 [Trebouxia sp. C0004]